MMARMDKQIEEQRAEEYKRFLSSNTDPRARAMAAAMEQEAKGEALDVDRGHRDLSEMGGENEAEPTEVVDGAAKVQPFVEPAKPAQRVTHKGDDPLGEYVVRKDGKPFFKTLVDGKEELVPLDRARAQLQKHLAADVRLQQLAEQRKALDAREVALRQRETKGHPSAPKAPVIDDSKLARDLVRSLVSEPEGKAAEKMAETFKAIRQASGPQIDLAEIRRQAADEARQAVVAERQREAFASGFDRFQQDYPDIARDSDLFALADRKTETISVEHPEWTPVQVMLEAGRQTREWLTSIGAKPAAVPNPKLPASVDPVRQQRKENLVPMPQPRGQRALATQSDEADDSPTATLAEIRKSRGQPN
jgi:hypothetical protein